MQKKEKQLGANIDGIFITKDVVDQVVDNISIEFLLRKKLKNHVKTLGNLKNGNLYEMVLKEIEKPLIVMVLQETKGNQLKTSNILGINRNTLRKKMKEFKITKKNILKNLQDN